MNFYRYAYQLPNDPKIHRATIVCESREALPLASKLCRIGGKGYLLSIVEDRPAQINEELQLT